MTKNLPRVFAAMSLFILLSGFLVGDTFIDKVKSFLARYRQLYPQEKLFFHLDRPYYFSGEKIFFKGYLIDSEAGKLSPGNNLVYLHLTGTERVLSSSKILAKDGLIHGYFQLPENLDNGLCQISAYTNLMKNLGIDVFFEKTIKIYNRQDPKSIEKHKGSLAKLSFHPEGGTLINGFLTKVAVRALDNMGNGVSIKGKVLSTTGNEVTSFSTDEDGLGTFTFVPKFGEQYFTTIEGKQWEVARVRENGASLQILYKANSFQVSVRSNLPESDQLTLIVQAKGQLLYGANGTGKGFITTIPKSSLPEGINQITLFDNRGVSIAERMVFVGKKTPTKVKISLTRNDFAPREKVVGSIDFSQLFNDDIAYLSISAVNRGGKRGTTINDLALLQEFKNLPDGLLETEDLLKTDNYLMTESSVRYDWDRIKDPQPHSLNNRESSLSISGLITDLNDQPVSNDSITVTIPGQLISYQGVSDSNGQLNIPIFHYYGSEFIVVQPLNNNRPTNTLKISFPDENVFSLPEGLNIVGNNTLLSDVEKEAVNQQIMEAYNVQYIVEEQTPDSFKDELIADDYSALYNQEIILSEYQAFATIRDVIREIVTGVYVPLDSDDIKVYSPEQDKSFDDGPLFLIDGVPTYDPAALLDLDPKDVEKIGVINMAKEMAYFRPAAQNGVLVVTTTHKNVENFGSDKNVVLYQGLTPSASISVPAPVDERTPYFQSLLYWDPNVEIDNQNNYEFEFFTSDEVGEIEIVVQGMTKSGDFVYILETITNGTVISN